MTILVPSREDLVMVGGAAFGIDERGKLAMPSCSCGCGGSNSCGSSACNCN